MATIDQTTANTTRRTKSSSSTHYEMHTLLYITPGLGALARGGGHARAAANNVSRWHQADALNALTRPLPAG
jgi:hypothetical protein